MYLSTESYSFTSVLDLDNTDDRKMVLTAFLLPACDTHGVAFGTIKADLLRLGAGAAYRILEQSGQAVAAGRASQAFKLAAIAAELYVM